MNRTGRQHKLWQLETETLSREKTPGAARREKAQAAPGTETKQTTAAGNHMNTTLREMQQRQNRKMLRSGVNTKEKMRGTN
jgi:hypothetical protein